MEKTGANQNNFNFISFITLISAISVVFLHVNDCFWEYPNVSQEVWISANIIESIFYFAVPVFFMITGATLIDYQERYDTKEYVKKRVKKTIIPFVFWSIFGMIFYLEVMTNNGIINENFHDMINSLINTKYISIYWFFPALMCIYFIIFVFSTCLFITCISI